MKTIVISGVTGMDGSLMADYLLKNTDAIIYGIIRQLSVPNHKNILHLKGEERFNLIEGDISDPHSMSGIINHLKPDYFINFAANSFVATSWGNPAQVMENNTMSVLHQLEAIRRYSPHTRYYQAGSSEEFGDVQYSPQDEKHPLRPRSPYGASKAAARHIVKTYRESYGLYAVCGWLFNHEGVRRGEQFVTRKITKGVARIKKAIECGDKFEPIELGNLEARRDWSNAEDFVQGVWMMLNQDIYNSEIRFFMPSFINEYSALDKQFLVSKIKDYVLASGETHTIREFIEKAFRVADINIFNNNPSHIGPAYASGGYQVNYSLNNSVPVVIVSQKFYRPNEVELLLGDSTNIRKDLGWTPRTSFEELVSKMVLYDISLTSL